MRLQVGDNYCSRQVGIDTDKLNVNGRPIAIGHPMA